MSNYVDEFASATRTGDVQGLRHLCQEHPERITRVIGILTLEEIIGGVSREEAEARIRAAVLGEVSDELLAAGFAYADSMMVTDRH